MNEAIDYLTLLSHESIHYAEGIDLNKKIKKQMVVIESVLDGMSCRKNILNYLDYKFLMKEGDNK
ncbi:MAG: hypothetical protein H7177_02670 [Rhizobacter sp.]|nr:hypothetical protein [Bacteriovorax sp.]